MLRARAVVPKYRRAVLTERVFTVLRTAWQKVSADFECEPRETGWESDQIDLRVAYPPKVAFSRLVNSLTGVNERRVQAAKLP